MDKMPKVPAESVSEPHNGFLTILERKEDVK